MGLEVLNDTKTVSHTAYTCSKVKGTVPCLWFHWVKNAVIK